VIDTAELLARLKAREISQAAVARALNLDPAQISKLYSGIRQIKLDEAKRLVEAFRLDDKSVAPPINEQTARLLILHVADTLGIDLPPSDERVATLAADFQAFSQFARGRLPSPTPDATAGFLTGRATARSPRGPSSQQ
jgi:transcriptional regulator with XRE-family HTH domain